MTAEPQPQTLGPVEAVPCPETLPAHVVSPTEPHRVHGYAVLGDLARNYDFGEYAVTALCGSPPTPDWGRAANLALVALSLTTVADAPVHAATVSRRCAAPVRVSLAIGLLGLTEQADAMIHASATAPREPLTDAARELWCLLPASVRATVDAAEGTLEQLAIRILQGAGLRSEMQLCAAVCLARLSTLAAETEAIEPGDLRSYPMRAPNFTYGSGS